jgi:hypothetical protein
MTRSQFAQDQKTIYAVVRAFEIIGEAAKKELEKQALAIATVSWTDAWPAPSLSEPVQPTRWRASRLRRGSRCWDKRGTDCSFLPRRNRSHHGPECPRRSLSFC